MRTGLVCLTVAAICAAPVVTASGKGASATKPEVSMIMPGSFGLDAVLRDGLAYQAKVNKPVGYAAALFVPKKAARKWNLGKKSVTIAEGVFQVQRAGTFPHALTDFKRKKKLRALLKNDDFNALRVVFMALASDAAGNRVTFRKKLKLTD